MSNFKFIRHYFGISGCFKGTTIKAELEDKNNNGDSKVVMLSDIKLWKMYEKEFNLEQSDLNYAVEYLCKLKNFIYDFPFPNNIRTILVERGVSDMLFYWMMKHGEDEKYIKKFVKEEEILEEQYSYYNSEKILLVQKDRDFIRDVVLKEKTRADCFPGGVEDYLKQQEDYIDFTRKYNRILKVVEIKDAEKYIKNDLGLEFNPGK